MEPNGAPGRAPEAAWLSQKAQGAVIFLWARSWPSLPLAYLTSP